MKHVSFAVNKWRLPLNLITVSDLQPSGTTQQEFFTCIVVTPRCHFFSLDELLVDCHWGWKCTWLGHDGKIKIDFAAYERMLGILLFYEINKLHGLRQD